ncbi:RNHCP domain-containing protein [Vibrio sp. B1FIG11]|uniref:RNHCP domain-containing protein n=1 Tax=Vibrio sp. B1FIG11 TaxID=2751177 RepID=UPI0021E0FEFE|nr:RNHCP domain-containing protein [Vibrio sp. B1FIG11]
MGVAPIKFGGQHRNHCPHCLCSVHMDIKAGDRRSSCRGIMEPISIYVQKKQRVVHNS